MGKICGLLTIVLLIGSSVSGVPLADNLESNELPTKRKDKIRLLSFLKPVASNMQGVRKALVLRIFFAISKDRDTRFQESEFLNGIDKCAYKSDTTDIASCATERIVRSLDKLSAQQSLEIFPGVSLLSDGSNLNYRSGKELKDEIEQAKANDGSMLELIGNAMTKLFGGRTLKIKLPDSEAIGRALEEGRKRAGGGGGGGGGNKKKGNDMMKNLMSIGGILAAMVPIFLGKVALIATKALIIGKLAFILGGILLFQMFRQNNNHGTGHDSSWSVAPQISYGPPSGSYGSPSNSYGPPSTSYGVPSGPYSRSLTDAQELAYAAQK